MVFQGRALKWFLPNKFSFLTLRILLIVIFPTGMFFIGLLHLDQYRETVFEAKINALYRQGNTLARSIGLTDSEHSEQAQQKISELTMQRASQLIASIPDARIRIFQPDGILINDSLQSSKLFVPNIELTTQPDIIDYRISRILRRLTTQLTAVLSPKVEYPLYQELQNFTANDFMAVQLALKGDAARQLMRDHRGELIVAVAVPIQHLRVVRGALLLTASGAEIEHDIVQVQIALFEIFGGILFVTIGLGYYLSRSIIGPIIKLSRRANMVRLSENAISGKSLTPDGSFAMPELLGRRDEIGTLARDLTAMTDELQSRMKATASFAADVSHEIKNPLTSLRSAVETMGLIKDEAKQQRLMAIIVDDVVRLDRLISDISAASRLDEDLSSAEFMTTDIGELLQSFVDNRQLTSTGAVRLVYNRPSTKVVATLAQNRFVQVLDNVLANAASFSPNGGKITINLTQENNMTVITIDDEGQGIPSSKLDTIFDRFYTERPSGEEFGRHSGLGLSISRQIAHAHGGSITASNRNNDVNTDGGGARITITLPMV